MEAYSALRSAPVYCKLEGFGSRSGVPSAHRANFLSVDAWCTQSSRSPSGYSSTSLSKHGLRRSVVIPSRRNFRIRASLTSSSSNSYESSSSSNSSESSSIAPLQMESPVGQFLSQILLNHPHLLPAAVDQQLQQLQIDREAEKKEEEPSSTGGEVKANDRKRALEEILYALVVQKFVEADVSLVPSLSATSDPSGRVDVSSSGNDKLKRLHSSEAYEMIKNHLSLILGQRLDDGSAVTPITKLRVGQVYAASIMYGYFLKRVDQRFQLEKSMKILPWGNEDQDSSINQSIPDESRPFVGKSHPEAPSWSSAGTSSPGFGDRVKPCRLRTYVMSFDADTLQRYAAVRSKEAFGIIEKHTEALFGRPEIVITPQGTIDPSKDEIIKISFGGLKRLILEAVTFGSFLWDVESYVDSRYTILWLFK